METTQNTQSTTTTTKRKWTSTTGPRITKAIDGLMRKIAWEGQGYKEITGIIGGESCTAILTPMFGPVSDVCRAELDRIALKHDYTITDDNRHAVEADLTAALQKVIAERPIVDKRITPEQHAADLAERNQAAAEEEKAARVKAAQDEADKAALLQEYPYLERLDQTSKTRHALAGANIRLILKKHFPGQVFTVKTSSFSGGDDCNVSWTDGPTEKEVKALVGRFEGGTFDGMTDMYNYTSDVWHGLFGEVKYLFAGRSISPQRFIEAGEAEQITVYLTPYGGLDRNKMSEADMRAVSREVEGTSYYTAPTVDHGTTPSDDPAQYTPDTLPQVRRNIEKGGIEIVFPAKPGQDTIDALKRAGFYWSPRQHLWYTRYTPEKEAAAKELAGIA